MQTPDQIEAQRQEDKRQASRYEDAEREGRVYLVMEAYGRDTPNIVKAYTAKSAALKDAESRNEVEGGYQQYQAWVCIVALED